ncbi:hypothetical protein V6N13_045529 [Hibiscus sabdariffa]
MQSNSSVASLGCFVGDMASNFRGFTTVFLLSLNLLFFTLVSSQVRSPVLAPPPSSCSGQELGVRFSAPSDLNSP